MLAVALRLLLIDRDDLVRVLLGLVKVRVARVPDKVLEELVRVLLLDDKPRGLNDVARVGDELAAL